MSAALRAADARFLLPAPAAITVVGDLGDWARAVAELAPPERAPHAVVGPAPELGERVRDADAAIVVGGGPRPDRPGWQWREMLVRPGPVGPRLVLPLGDAAVARYALTVALWPVRARHRVRNHLVARMVGRAHVPGRMRVAVGAPPGSVPYAVAAARDLGVPADPGWFLALGDGDDLQRAVFHVFAPGADEPGWVVKLARRPGDDAPFAAEARAAALLGARAPRAAARAPRLLGRCDVDTPASVETAAVGPPLHAVLDGRGGGHDRDRLVVAAVDWIEALGAESRGPLGDAAAERERLRTEVLPHWPQVPGSLLDRLGSCAPVLAHHDLGAWNMVAAASGPMVVDWESARYPALPLWDLLYFLTDALVARYGPADPATKVSRALGLLRGDLPESDRLRAWVRGAAHRAGIPREQVGVLATLAWLHHGTSPARRDARAATLSGGRGGVAVGWLTALAQGWLDDPALGVEWRALGP